MFQRKPQPSSTPLPFFRRAGIFCRFRGHNDTTTPEPRRKGPLQKKGRPAIISLPGGVSVRALWSERTTAAHIGDARRIQADLVRDQEEAVLRRLKPLSC